jgi:hypothetical protein
MKPDDPAYWMLEKGLAERAREKTEARFHDPYSTEETALREKWCTSTDVYNETCYICRDPEYALMGLPLCFPCTECGGHVAADDTVCDECGHDEYPFDPDKEL